MSRDRDPTIANSSVVRGLTWDHPRGCQALAVAAKRAATSDFAIAWDKQPLEEFESHPIEDLAARYDLIVLDHPHIGEAVKARCLRPLDEVFDAGFLADLAQDAIGSAFSSYVYRDRAWALPLDAAAQVLAMRSDLVDAPLPTTWWEIEALAATVPVCLSLAGPHAILTFLSICVALGEAPAARDPAELVSRATGRAAWALLSAIHKRTTRAAIGLNPIGILELMAGSNEVALCPLVYGYVTYARSSHRPYTITFADAPAIATGGRPGSTLGGTGIALSKRCTPTPALRDHLALLMSRATQETLIPAEAGQPGLRSAWLSEAVNASAGNFYRNTVRTLESAWVRPRHPGYIAWQALASKMIANGLQTGAAADALLDRLQDRFTTSRRTGEPL
jgi:multiple sugar transport system substrate-binding protein